jgi:hypothetical protein
LKIVAVFLIGGENVAVELEELYREIRPKYKVELHTESCFQKMIIWIHMAEYIDYIPRLHADELVFNSGLNNISNLWLENYIKKLNEAHAGGLIIALRKGRKFSQEIIDYCNEIKFPLFSATWDAPYNDIMRTFAMMLLSNEQSETNLIASVKNAIFYPENEELYLPHFERNGFFRDMDYTVLLMGCKGDEDQTDYERLQRIGKSVRYTIDKGIVYEDEKRLTILLGGVAKEKIRKTLNDFCDKQPDVYVGIGSVVRNTGNIHRSYESAYIAYQLARDGLGKKIVYYDELGVYKLLADIKEASIYPKFVQDTLGNLLDYDREHRTDYVDILKTFFENECNMLATSKALYCHKNTLTYKMNKIRDILGYDVMTNENRTRIMLAFYIIQMGMYR